MLLSDKLPVDIKIEKGIPIPPKKHLYTKGLRHEFDIVNRMEVGDSFEVNDRKLAAKIQAWINRETQFKLATRKMENGRIRIWRVK